MSDDTILLQAIRRGNPISAKRAADLLSQRDGAVAELARTESELTGVRNVCTQQQRALEAERAARTRSDAVVATLREWLAGDVSGSAVRVALAQYDEALKATGKETT